MDYSLRAYCSLLYRQRKFKIIVRGTTVAPIRIEDLFDKKKQEPCTDTHPTTGIQCTVGWSVSEAEGLRCGVHWYWLNRLIKPYHHVGVMANPPKMPKPLTPSGSGLTAVLHDEKRLLTPIHTKQVLSLHVRGKRLLLSYQPLMQGL